MGLEKLNNLTKIGSVNNSEGIGIQTPFNHGIHAVSIIVGNLWIKKLPHMYIAPWYHGVDSRSSMNTKSHRCSRVFIY